MQKIYSKFKIICILILICQLSSKSEPAYNELLNALIQGDSESVINAIESEKGFKPNKLSPTVANLYAISLITTGDLNKTEEFVTQRKEPEFKEFKKQINLFEKKYESKDLEYSELEKQHIELIHLMTNHLNSCSNGEDCKISKEQVLNKLSLITQNIPYCPTRLEYLLELNENSQVEKEAIANIKNFQNVLFPKPMDFYQLAISYKALAILSYKAKNEKKARQFIKLAQDNISKMRCIWIEEDFIIEHPILKNHERKTSFGYLIPQWIILLKEEYKEYLLN